MPEYLSPGVFIEEIPAQLKAIEGVSTSTAGFVGEAERGPVPGWLPFPVPSGFQLVADDAPILVTSYAEFRHSFGVPAADPANDGYLGHAVRAFFDNGGKRAYIARAMRQTATAAFHQLDQGAVLRLRRTVKPNDTVIHLSSLRGIQTGAKVTFIAPDGTTILNATVTGYSPQDSSITVGANAITQTLLPDQVAVISDGITRTPNKGPKFWARSPGAWGANLKILVSCSDRPPVKVAAPANAGASTIQLMSSGSFYIGALVEIDDGTGKRYEAAVTDILPGNTLKVDPVTAFAVTAQGSAQVAEIDILIADSGSSRFESYKGLCWNADADPLIRARHYSTVINNGSSLVFVEPPWLNNVGGSESPPSHDSQPMSAFGFPAGPSVAAEEGSDGNPMPGRDHIIGIDNGPGQRSGIQSLQDIDDIRIIAAPGETAETVQNELISQAERMRYRFAVLDGESNPTPDSVVNAILKHRNNYDTSYAGYYTPWLQVGLGDQIMLMPPSGHVIGIYARVDNDRGVWKAPANEVIRGITGLRSYITTGEQDILNPRGANAIRRFEGRGIRVWGARTLSSDPEFKYINVRRFLIFMEASIDRGTQWVVFEPNSPETWSRVVDSVSAFLHTQWRDGALFGRKPEDSFYVRCDETTMTADDVQNGRLICEIGVAIVRPAEFVIFRIEQITGFGKSN